MAKKMLVYAYYARNIGDDLFLKVLFDRYPDTSWDLLTANRNYKDIFKNYHNVNIIYSYREVVAGDRKFNLFFKLNEFLFNFKKYDGFIIIGGSLFIQSPAWQMKLEEREYLLKVFKRAGKKAYLLGANFGPFKDDNYVGYYRNLFATFDDVCFRDTYSYELFKNLPNVRLAPDVVFNLKVDDQAKKEKTIGFSLIDLEKRDGLKEHNHVYQEKVIQLIDYYGEKGYDIKMFSFCENEGDLQVIQKVKENTNQRYRNRIAILNYQGNLLPFLEAFQSCETIVGTRFHSIVLAILFNQKFFPLVYSDKTFNLLHDLGLADHYCRIEDIKHLTINQLNESLKQNDGLNRKGLVEAAESQFEKLDLFIKDKNLVEAK